MMFNNPNSYEEVKSLISEDEYKKIYGGSDRLISEKEVNKVIMNYYALDYRIDEVLDAIKAIPSADPKTGHWIHIDDVMSVFDDFMCGEVDEDGTDTFLEMLRDKAESER